jgi:regulator of sigma D
VKQSIRRIQSELGIGYRRITVSTVGIVRNIPKLATDLPQVRLAVSLHCATDEERTALIPANKWNGSLDTLMETLRDYVNGNIQSHSETENEDNDGVSNANMKSRPRRLTLEWALIEGENDTPEQAHALGKLIGRWFHSRRDMVHINVIPLNPTAGYSEGKPSSRHAVNKFCNILTERYGVTCTPRVRRGIDINAGCGQLSAQVKEKDQEKLQMQVQTNNNDEFHDNMINNDEEDDDNADTTSIPLSSWNMKDDAVMLSDDDDPEDAWEEYEFTSDQELDEAARLIRLVQGTTIATSPSPSEHK